MDARLWKSEELSEARVSHTPGSSLEGKLVSNQQHCSHGVRKTVGQNPRAATAHDLIRVGQLEEAEKAFDACLRDNPTCIASLAGKFTIELQRGNIEAALSFLQRELRVNEEAKIRRYMLLADAILEGKADLTDERLDLLEQGQYFHRDDRNFLNACLKVVREKKLKVSAR